MHRTAKRVIHLVDPDTATLGLFLSLMVILGIARTAIGEAAFADWGWRVPFIVSIAILAVYVDPPVA